MQTPLAWLRRNPGCRPPACSKVLIITAGESACGVNHPPAYRNKPRCILRRLLQIVRMEGDKKLQVVVVGAGFGGLTFCKHFQMADARITVVDRTNHHLFQPLLYQVAACGLSAPDIAQPIRSILSRRPDLEVLLDEVKSFDLAGKRILCRHNTLPYDYLVLALGSVTSYFGHP